MRELRNIADKVDCIIVLALTGVVIFVLATIFILVKIRSLNTLNKTDQKKLPLNRILWH
jgi:hypothetical protein